LACIPQIVLEISKIQNLEKMCIGYFLIMGMLEKTVFSAVVYRI